MRLIEETKFTAYYESKPHLRKTTLGYECSFEYLYQNSVMPIASRVTEYGATAEEAYANAQKYSLKTVKGH